MISDPRRLDKSDVPELWENPLFLIWFYNLTWNKERDKNMTGQPHLLTKKSTYRLLSPTKIEFHM